MSECACECVGECVGDENTCTRDFLLARRQKMHINVFECGDIFLIKFLFFFLNADLVCVCVC